MLILLEPPAPDAMDAYQQNLHTLCGAVLQQLWANEKVKIDEGSLKTLSIRKGRPLDSKTSDDAARPSPDCFFVPHPNTFEFGDKIADAHRDEYPNGWTDFCDKNHTKLSCSLSLKQWCSVMLQEAFRYDDSRTGYWNLASLQLCHRDEHRLRVYSGARVHPHIYGGVGYDNEPGFAADPFFRAIAMGQPHVGCILREANVPTNKNILRSEVVTAIELLRHELMHDKFPGHTIPIMIYTIGHGNACRVTQFHFDGKYLNYRQSRVFDLGSARIHDVLKDAMELLMWMRCRPVGQTRYGRR